MNPTSLPEYIQNSPVLDRSGNPIRSIDYSRVETALKQAIDDNDNDTIAEMIKLDVDLDELNFNPLAYALEAGKIESVKTLLFFNADPLQNNGEVFVLSAQQNNRVVLNLLCEDNMPEKETRKEMVHTALQNNHRSFLEMMELRGHLSDLTDPQHRADFSQQTKDPELLSFLNDLLDKAQSHAGRRGVVADKFETSAAAPVKRQAPKLRSRRSKSPGC